MQKTNIDNNIDIDICIYTAAFIWRFVRIKEIVQVYRCILANKTRFSAEYAAAKARGDESVTLTGGSLAPFELYIRRGIDCINIDRVMDKFLGKMWPFVKNYLLNETSATATNTTDLYTSLMIKADRNDVDSAIHFGLATAVLNLGADEVRKNVLAEQTAMTAFLNDEYMEHVARHRA
jgi:hypothetical protein